MNADTAIKGRTRGAEICFVLLLFILVFFSHTRPGSVNDASYFSLTENLLQRQTFMTDESVYTSIFRNRLDMSFLKGHFYSGKQPLLGTYLAAVLFPAHLFFKFGSEMGRAVLYYLSVLGSSGAAALVLFYFINKAFLLVRADEKKSPWTMAFIFFGTPLLAFSVTLNNHVPEAPFLFAAFYYLLDYRARGNHKSPMICGLVLGTAALLHILAGLIFICLTAVYFLTSKIKDFFRFLLAVVFIFTCGAALNQLEHGNPKMFYMMPESFLYVNCPGFARPSLSYLTPEKITARMDELGLPQSQKIAVLVNYYRYRSNVSGALEFARQNFLTRDFLNFSPIFLAGLLSILLCFFRKGFQWKREALWVLAGAALIYTGLIHSRSDAGWSFSNRYLISVTPLVIFFTVFYFEQGRNLAFFKLIFWLALAMMLPGVFQPWVMPNENFLRVNLVLNAIFFGGHLLSYVFGFISKAAENLIFYFQQKPWIAAILIALLIRFEFCLYTGRLIF